MRKVNFGLLAGGVLHSKFWIVDRKHVFIGSANMDWRAITQVKLDTSSDMGEVSLRPSTVLLTPVSNGAALISSIKKNNLWISRKWHSFFPAETEVLLCLHVWKGNKHLTMDFSALCDITKGSPPPP